MKDADWPPPPGHQAAGTSIGGGGLGEGPPNIWLRRPERYRDSNNLTARRKNDEKLQVCLI